MKEQDIKTKQMMEDRKVIESIRQKNLELENERIKNDKIKKEQEDVRIKKEQDEDKIKKEQEDARIKKEQDEAKNAKSYSNYDHENISFSPEHQQTYRPNNEN